jgi:hypothetical protein
MFMPGLSDSQLSTVSALINSAPDAALRSLHLALLSDSRIDGPMAEIRDLVDAEAVDRRARGLVFAPIAGMCVAGQPAYPRKTFPSRTPGLLWAALKVARPAEVQQATGATLIWTAETTPPDVFDALLLACAAGLREPAGTPFATAAALLDEAQAGDADLFASYLDLAPLARVAMTKLPEWLGRMTNERAAAVRLAFRDATEIAKDAGPRLVEILASRLDEPWRILRLICAVMDRPHDAFLAASELAPVGERLLGQIEAHFDALNHFDARGGAAAGRAAAEAVRMISIQIAEFEESIDLKKDGPWGGRVGQLKALTAQKAEAIIAKADAAVADLLPLKRRGGGKLRGAPIFDQPIGPEAAAKAEAMMAFVEQSRAAAMAGGYASTRTKMIEKLDDRLDHYVEDVLEYLRGDGADKAASARLYLDSAARLIGLLRDEKAAQIVRRRAAA